MPVFTAIGTALGFAGTAATGMTAFGAGVAATAAAAGAAGAMSSSARQAEKQQENLVRDAQYAQGIEQEKTKQQIADIEAKSLADKKSMQEASGIAAETARQEEVKRRVKTAKTLLTTPQGVLGEANTNKKVLLGG